MENNNIYFVKISGKVNIPNALAISHNYKLVADCSIVSEQKSDNENGEFSVTYKLVPVTAEITKDNGQIVRAKDPRKNSVKLRNMIWKEYYNEGYTPDFDRVYDESTNVILGMIPMIVKEAIKRIDPEHTTFTPMDMYKNLDTPKGKPTI